MNRQTNRRYNARMARDMFKGTQLAYYRRQSCQLEGIRWPSAENNEPTALEREGDIPFGPDW